MIQPNARLPIVLLFTIVAGPTAGSAEEWTRHTIDAGSRGADGVRLADMNNDGRLDIVTPWEEAGVVRIAFDRGLTETPRWLIDTVGRERSVEDAVGVDLNDDGVREVVACAEGNARAVCVFQRQPQAKRWSQFDLGDSRGNQQYMFAEPLTVNGRTHLVSGGKNSGASVSLWSPSEQPGDFANWTERRLRPAGWIMSICAIDLNQDGVEDIVYSDRKGTNRGVWWLPCSSEGPIANAKLIGGRDHEVMFLKPADFDQDGDIDLVVAARPQTLLLFERLSETGEQWRERVVELPKNFGLGKGVAVDASSTGTEIFVSAGPLADRDRLSIIRLRWNDPRLVMTTPADSVDAPGGTVGVKFDRIELIDLDGDGDRDLLTCEERSNLGVVWYERP